MSVSQETFLAAMRQMPASVTIIATAAGDSRFGFTATSVCSLSVEPPQILVCVNQETACHNAILESKAFSVNLISTDQADLSTRFSSPPEEGRFETGEWSAGTSGAPILLNAVVSFECALRNQFDCGTHTIMIGAVIDAHLAAKPALLYCDGGYGRFASLSDDV